MSESSRANNSIRNISFGFVYKIIAFVLPFLTRTVLIYTIGLEYVGLSSLFTSVLNVLNLAELGVGSGMVYCMYDAVANNDDRTICALLNLYRKFYRIIGLVVFVLGIILIPFLRFFVSGDVPDDINLYILFLLYLINSSFSYLLYAYKSSLFIAFQRNDIVSKISAIVLVVQNSLQIVFLLCFKNFYFYIGCILLGTAFFSILINAVSNSKYTKFRPEGDVDPALLKGIISKVKALALYRIGGVVLVSVDSIVVSAFLGLKALGKYNNYFFIMNALFAFLAIFYDSVRSSIGNSIVVDSKEKNYEDFNKIFLLNSWLVGWCTVCLACLYDPFITIWVGVKMSYSTAIVPFLAVYFYTWKMMEAVNLYKDASGMWEYDRFRPLVASVINLILNVFLVNFIGIYGILISTIISIIFIIFPWSTIILFKYYFNSSEQKISEYFKRYLFYTLLTMSACFVTYYICCIIPYNSILGLGIKFLFCLIIPNIIFYFGFSFDKYGALSIVWVKKKVFHRDV